MESDLVDAFMAISHHPPYPPSNPRCLKPRRRLGVSPCGRGSPIPPLTG